MLPFADEAEQADSTQSWPGLFWMPPADDEPAERDMLHLDDELAGLMEAADMPADQAGPHSTKPEPVVSVPGEVLLAHSKSGVLLCPSAKDLPCTYWHTVTLPNFVACFFAWVIALAVLRCAALCCLCCAVLHMSLP